MQAASQARRVAEINVTPLIDIVLVLLIVFIVMVPMTGRHHPVAVPSTGVGISLGFPVIAIFRDGSCSLGGEPVTLEQLSVRLVPEVLRQPRLARRVQVKVDGAVPMHRTTEVLDAIRTAGNEARCETPGYVPTPDENDKRHEDDIRIAMTMQGPI